MQKATRQELNRRFNEVYSQLVEQGEIIKNDRQKSKSSFAERIGTKGHIVDLYLCGKRSVTYEQAKQLCATYQVNEAFMFQGIGQPFDKIKLPRSGRKISNGFGYQLFTKHIIHQH